MHWANKLGRKNTPAQSLVCLSSLAPMTKQKKFIALITAISVIKLFLLHHQHSKLISQVRKTLQLSLPQQLSICTNDKKIQNIDICCQSYKTYLVFNFLYKGAPQKLPLIPIEHLALKNTIQLVWEHVGFSGNQGLASMS